MTQNKIRETDLYLPVKALFKSQGYEVKGEVGAADIVAIREKEDPVIVELKTGFTLSLFHQAVERQSITDHVYIAVPRGSGRVFSKSLKNNRALCRRLGIGLITVRLRDQMVEVHLDPMPYRPRKSKPKKARLLKEFAKRIGDPNLGGTTRQTLVTAYRQDAVSCARFLREHGPQKAANVAKATGIDVARRIMADDYYGWFERIERGIYALSSKGHLQIKAYL